MGQFWNETNGGIYTDIPPAGTKAFLNWKDSIIDHRINECPISRTNKIYVEVDVINGSAIGGGGNGTENNPYLVSNANEFVSLVQAELDDDQEWICSGVASGQSSRLTVENVENVTFRSWEGKPKFMLNGFTEPLLGWEEHDGGSNIFTRTVIECFWVIDDEDDPTGDFSGHIQTGGYPRYDDLEDLEELSGSDRGWFFDSSTNVLYVRRTTDVEPTGIRVCVNSQDGFLVSGSYDAGEGTITTDNIRFHNIEMHGHGMNRTTSATQNYPIRHSANGPSRVVVSSCKGYFSHHHGISSLISGAVGNANVVGAVFTCVNTETGGCLQDGATSRVYTSFNSYAVNGLNEFYARGCTSKLGWLSIPIFRNNSPNAFGTTFFGHTDANGTNPVGLALIDDCHIDESQTHPDYRLATFANLVTPDDHTDTTQYRMFIVGCSHKQTTVTDDNVPQIALSRAVFVNSRFELYNNVQFSATGVITNTNPRWCYFINCKIIQNIRAFAGLWRYNEDLSPDHDTAKFTFYHCHIAVIGNSGSEIYLDAQPIGNNPWSSALVRLKNTIVSHHPDSATTNLLMRLANEGIGVGTWAGGFNNCAFYDINSNQYDNTVNPITLSTFQEVDETPTEGDLFEGGVELTGAETIEYDALFRTRNIDAPTIGPLELDFDPPEPTEDFEKRPRKMFDKNSSAINVLRPEETIILDGGEFSVNTDTVDTDTVVRIIPTSDKIYYAVNRFPIATSNSTLLLPNVIEHIHIPKGQRLAVTNSVANISVMR